MSVLLEIIGLVLTAYLGLVNNLAVIIGDFLPSERHTNPVQIDEFTSLPSEYEYGGQLPKVLINNATYQQASVLSGIATSRFSSADPRDAVVNIFCEYKTKDYVRSTTGSGYFISPDGVILTNAHVAQFLLLEDMDTESETNCVVRTGLRASSTYEAELLYISPAWIIEHANLINEVKPKGTGERDYALLYITRRTDNQAMSNKVPAIYPDLSALNQNMYGDNLSIAGYPSKTITAGDKNLIPTQSTGTSSLYFLYTFGSKKADLMSLTGSVIGGSGMSGGPVINADGDAIGLIVTRGDDNSQGAGSLNAITLSYIDRTITEETNLSLPETLQGDLPKKSKIFKDTMVPILAEILSRELE